MWFYRRFLYCLQIYGNTARVCRVIEKQTFLYLVIVKMTVKRHVMRRSAIDIRESRLFRWLKFDLHFSSAKFACIRSFIERKYYEKNNIT